MWSTGNCVRNLNFTKSPPVLENEKRNSLWCFVTQVDHLISSERPDLVKIIKQTNKQTKEEKKKTRWIVDFAFSAYHRVKIKEHENEKM